MARILCNDLECLHCKRLEQKEQIQYHRDFEPFDDCGYLGECTRDIVGIQPEVITTRLANYDVVKCMTRSDKKLTGHLDWSRLGPHFVDEEGIKEHERRKKRTQFGSTGN